VRGETQTEEDPVPATPLLEGYLAETGLIIETP
jgi:hypothetical protein